MSKSTLGTLVVLAVLVALILLFGGELQGGLLSGLFAGTMATLSYSYFKKKQEKEDK